MLCRHLEVLIKLGRGGGFAKGGDTDDAAVQADILVPEVRVTRLDGHARQACGQHLVAVGRILAVEGVGAGHGDHAGRDALFGQHALRLERDFHFGAGGDQHDLRLAALRFGQHIAAARNSAFGVFRVRGGDEILPRQQQGAGAMLALDGVLPGHRGFEHVGRAPHIQIGDEAQAGRLLDRLVRRAVFAQTDGVVREDVDDPLLHQRAHAHAVARVVGEHQEGAAVGQEAAMQRHAVHHGHHAEFAHAIRQIVERRAGRGLLEGMRGLDRGEVGTGQVGRTAEQARQRGHQGFKRDLRGLARGGRRSDLARLGIQGLHGLTPIGRQIAGHAALEFGGQCGMGLLIGGEALVPVGFELGAVEFGVPGLVNVGGNFKRAVVPAQGLAGGVGLGLAERGAVHIVRAGLVGRTPADGGAANDERGFVAGLGFGGGFLDGNGVMAVDGADDVPAIGLEALRGVVGEPVLDMTVDGNAVVVVVGDELVELERAGQRADLVADALHQAAVAEEHIGVVIDDGMAGLVELRGQHFFGQRHAHAVGDALTQRASGGFHARRVAHFGVARRFAVQLAEALELLDRQVVAGEMQQGVDQHRAVAVGQHEAVAVGPVRIGRVVVQVIAPQHFGDVGHAHGGAGVAGVGGLHAVDGEKADGVGQTAALLGVDLNGSHVEILPGLDNAVNLRDA